MHPRHPQQQHEQQYVLTCSNLSALLDHALASDQNDVLLRTILTIAQGSELLAQVRVAAAAARCHRLRTRTWIPVITEARLSHSGQSPRWDSVALTAALALQHPRLC